jgi:hypothetical protein
MNNRYRSQHTTSRNKQKRTTDNDNRQSTTQTLQLTNQQQRQTTDDLQITFFDDCATLSVSNLKPTTTDRQIHLFFSAIFRLSGTKIEPDKET